MKGPRPSPQGRATYARCGGNVSRWHTWTTMQRQSNADHTYHVMRIWREIFGPLSSAVTDAVLYHDSVEYLTGDMVHDVKLRHPELKTALTDVENSEWRYLDLPEDLVRVGDLSQTDGSRLKACDLLEMVEFTEMELALGNSTFRLVRERLREALLDVSLCRLSLVDRAKVWRTYTDITGTTIHNGEKRDEG